MWCFVSKRPRWRCVLLIMHIVRDTVTCSLATMYIHNTGDMFLKLVEALFGYSQIRINPHMCVGVDWSGLR